MIDFHKAMIRIHRKYEILKTGSLAFLWNDYQGLAYTRFSREEQIIVIINNRQEDREVEIPLWQAGISRLGDVKLQRIMVSDKDNFTEPGGGICGICRHIASVNAGHRSYGPLA